MIYDLNGAAELRYSTLADVERRLAAEEAQLAVQQDARRLLREVVTDEEIVEIERIVELMFDDLRSRLADRRITLGVTEGARRFIATQGFDPVYGAHPLRRFIAREVDTRIGRALLTDAIPDGASIRVDLKGDGLVIPRDEDFAEIAEQARSKELRTPFQQRSHETPVSTIKLLGVEQRTRSM